jgi:EAL domain-containing protein (putative c-di-GMP-specific phosphodiesterase class I)
LALSVAKQAARSESAAAEQTGHAIWLDDIDDVLVQSFLSCRLPLSGIKIDKEAFWRLRDTPALRQLVSLCFQLAGKVLIEGIETERDRTWALQAGADLGQGYYWPSWTWPED